MPSVIDNYNQYFIPCSSAKAVCRLLSPRRTRICDVFYPRFRMSGALSKVLQEATKVMKSKQKNRTGRREAVLGLDHELASQKVERPPSSRCFQRLHRIYTPISPPHPSLHDIVTVCSYGMAMFFQNVEFYKEQQSEESIELMN